MAYTPHADRYTEMIYNRCGNSGLKLPALSLGLWHNFGNTDFFENCRSMVHTAFDNGITHFDLANNYGPPPGAAEETFGNILHEDLKHHRDELIISSKAGWPMWPGPYGDWGSKKHLMSSLDQSLQRLRLDYVDIFYHHRPDPDTPMEETMATLDLMVRQGKALYVGVSSYDAADTQKAIGLLKSLGTPLLLHQPKYSLLERWIEDKLLDTIGANNIGCISFSSLAQGLLTNKYLNGVPSDSRAASNRGNGALESNAITPALLQKIKALDQLAAQRGQSLAQMALSWVLKDPRITSVIVGASKPAQITDALPCLNNRHFSDEELEAIDNIVV